MSRMAECKGPFQIKIKNCDDCARLEVRKSHRISEARSPGMKLDSYKFEAEVVDQGCAGKSTKQPQCFYEKFWTGIQTITMFTEQLSM